MRGGPGPAAERAGPGAGVREGKRGLMGENQQPRLERGFGLIADGLCWSARSWCIFIEHSFFKLFWFCYTFTFLPGELLQGFLSFSSWSKAFPVCCKSRCAGSAVTVRDAEDRSAILYSSPGMFWG